MLKTKVCTRCNKRKRVSLDPSKSAFDRRPKNSPSKPSGWQAHCKKCKAEARRYGYQDRRELVPIGPFAEWVRKWVADNNTHYANFKRKVGGIRLLADLAGVDESRVRALMNERYERVDIGTVDRFLTAADSDTQLWELYPDHC